MGTKIDLTGQRFGRLVALRIAVSPSGKRKWECYCNPSFGGCGNYSFVNSNALRVGATKSCGCFHRESSAARHTTHGFSRIGERMPEYRSWESMLRRCCNPRDTFFSRYGARGISVCERWRESFENFIADMGRKPTTRHSLDRINNDGNYEPSNCRWATPKEQARNRRSSKIISVDGVSMTLVEWSERTGINPMTIAKRLSRGASPKEAVDLRGIRSLRHASD